MSDMLLAIETSTSHGGVAVGSDGIARAEVTVTDTTRHSALLLPAIDFALHAAGVKREELAGIVAGAGPGSFTGVRVAAATARGLAAALGIPLHAYSSLAALAASASRGDEPVCAMFDARRGEVYGACYRFTDHIETLLAPRAAHADDIVHAVADEDVEFAGEGAHAYASRLPREPLPLALAQPRASALLWLAHFDPAAGRIAAPSAFEPVYVRDSSAIPTVA